MYYYSHEETMKHCARCGMTKPRSQFHRHTRRPDGLQTVCKACRADIDHERYEKKVGMSVPRHPQHSERGRKAWLVSLKTGRPCADCGRIFPHQVMQWDHLPGHEKLGEISASSWGRTREDVLSEIAKCELVCANCHAMRTFARSGARLKWLREDTTFYDALALDGAAWS